MTSLNRIERCIVLEAYVFYYRLTNRQRSLLRKYIVQFGACRSDEARRRLLGLSA